MQFEIINMLSTTIVPIIIQNIIGIFFMETHYIEN